MNEEGVFPATAVERSQPARPGGAAWVVIAGGGTIGHLNPGLAAAEALCHAGLSRSEIHFVGSRRGVEAGRLPSTGYAYTLLGGRGIQRRLTFENVTAICGLLRAFVGAFRLLGRLRPEVVLTTGGYASAPCALGAFLRRIPIVVAEQNAVPGVVNRLAARVAKASAVSFPGTDLPRAVLVGNPVRTDMLAVDRSRDRERARQTLGVSPQRTLIVAFGGSLGARRINDAVFGARALWADRSDLAIHHVVGDRDWPNAQQNAQQNAQPSERGLFYRAVRFEDAMPTVLAAADLAVCRAGASTIAELAVVGLPAVLVPLPIASEDHQTANARGLVDVGGAVSVPDAEFDAPRLVREVEALLADPAELARRGVAAISLARPEAARDLADLLRRFALNPFQESAMICETP